MKLDHSDTVCLVNENSLQAARKRWGVASRSPLLHFSAEGVAQDEVTAVKVAGLVRENLWRQFRVTGDASVLFLQLRTVSEVTQSADDWTVSSDAEYGFSWDDLTDRNFLTKMLAHEQFGVAIKVLNVLATLRANQGTLRKRLAESPSVKPATPDE